MKDRTRLPIFYKTKSVENNPIDELKNAFNVLRCLPNYKEILEHVEIDLLRESKINLGQRGMTAEQVLICLVVKQVQKASFQMLSELTFDSITVRDMMALGDFDEGFEASIIQDNIEKITNKTLNFICEALINKKRILMNKQK